MSFLYNELKLFSIFLVVEFHPEPKIILPEHHYIANNMLIDSLKDLISALLVRL